MFTFNTNKKKIVLDMPARVGGGSLNGLSPEDLDDDEYIDDSDELMAIRNTGNRLGGQLHNINDSRQCVP